MSSTDGWTRASARVGPRRRVSWLKCSTWQGAYWVLARRGLPRPSRSGAATYQVEPTPYQTLQREVVLHLGSVGGGGPRVLIGGAGRAFAQLLQRSSSVLDAPSEVVSLSDLAPSQTHVYARELGSRAVWVAWGGAPDPYHGDSLEMLDVRRLASLGETINLALITASRQYHY